MANRGNRKNRAGERAVGIRPSGAAGSATPPVRVRGLWRCNVFEASEYARSVREEADGLPIEFPGWRDDVAEVLSALDLVVVPSAVVDATPLVILEAFSAGVPVVAFRSGGIPEMIDDGVTGILCSPDPAELAQTLMKLMQCERARAHLHSLATRAKDTFAERFSLERYRSEVLQVVRDAM